MSDQENTLELDGLTFVVQHLSVAVSRRVSLRLARILGAALQNAKSVESLDLNQAGWGLIRGALAELTEADHDALCNAFAAVTMVQLPAHEATVKAGLDVNVPFAKLTIESIRERAFGGGQISREYVWLAFAVRYEYGDFFSGLANGSFAETLKPKTASG